MINPIMQGVSFGIITGAAITLDEKTLIPFGSAIAIGCFVFMVGRKYQHIEDKLTVLEKQINKLHCLQNDKCLNDKEDEN